MKLAGASSSLTPTAAAASLLLKLHSNTPVVEDVAEAVTCTSPTLPPPPIPPSAPPPLPPPTVPVRVVGAMARRIPKKVSLAHTMPAAGSPPEVKGTNSDSRSRGGNGMDAYEEGVRSAPHHQMPHKGSGGALQSRTLSSLVSNAALTSPFQAGGQPRLHPTPSWTRPTLLLLGDCSLSFSLLLLRCWPSLPARSSPAASVSLTPSASSATPAPVALTSLVAGRPIIHCLLSTSDLLSPQLSEAHSTALERGANLRTTGAWHPLKLSTSLPPSLRFDSVMLSIELENANSATLVDMLTPVFVSIAEVMNENGALRLVLGSGYSELRCLQELINIALAVAGLRFERKENLVFSDKARQIGAVDVMAAPDGFRDGAVFHFVRRPMQAGKDKEQDRVGRSGRVESSREKVIRQERAWEAMRHREREEQRRSALQREHAIPSP